MITKQKANSQRFYKPNYVAQTKFEWSTGQKPPPLGMGTWAIQDKERLWLATGH